MLDVHTESPAYEVIDDVWVLEGGLVVEDTEATPILRPRVGSFLYQRLHQVEFTLFARYVEWGTSCDLRGGEEGREK